MTLQFSRLAFVLLLSFTVGLHAEESTSSIARFEITRYELEGNTLLSQSAAQEILQPFTGKERTFSDVQRAQAAIEEAYRKLGYSVIRVVLPEQELNQGVVRFKITETRLNKVTVEGNNHHDEANIRNSLPRLRTNETLNMSAVSRNLKVANENPSKKTTLQLQSSAKDGEVDALLKVTDEKPWSGTVSIDNTGDANTGRNRMSVQLQQANVGGLDHVASLQYTTSMSHPSQVSVYGLGYHIPLYAMGDSLDFFGSYSDVDSGSVAAGLVNVQVSGKGTTFGTRYNHNFDRVGTYESKLIGGFDYKAFKTSVSYLGFPLGNDITVRPLSLTYSANAPMSGYSTDYYITGAQNIPGGDNGSSDDFNRARSGATASYKLLRYGANYMHPLPGDWLFHAAFNGQYTRDALVPGEQFGGGGATSVRGFSERAISNDFGRSISLEVYTRNLCGSIRSTPTQCRLLGFVDHAHVTRNNALPGEQTQESIGSIGLGLRMTIDKFLSLQLDVGHVVDGTDTQAKGEQRLHFKLVGSF
jgi:hemolysin activation/secretion protein